MLKDLVYKNRTCRRFDQTHEISDTVMEELVDLARVTASAGNLQPLKYVVANTREKCAAVFPNLGWAAYLKDWKGPVEGERPSGYVIIVCDTSISHNPGCDHGIAAQTILLGAVEKGLAGAMIGAVNTRGLQKALDIPDNLEIVLVVALGKPGEQVKLEDMGQDGAFRYWRDEDGVHHVPKRKLGEVLIKA